MINNRSEAALLEFFSEALHFVWIEAAELPPSRVPGEDLESITLLRNCGVYCVVDALGFADALVRVCEEQEREVVFLGELLMGGCAVYTNTYYLGALLTDLLVLVAESASLDCAAWSIVFGVEVEDEFLAVKVS